jgi:secondary thiamine-phosphate synthase enzyme
MALDRVAVARSESFGFEAELRLETPESFAFLDLTEEVALKVAASGVRTGVAHVHTSHTTTALVLNENEPLLLLDLRKTLERLAPDGAGYFHDDIARRGARPDEPKNGAAHCRALLLPSSQCLPVRHGRLTLGRWQSLFLVELDGPRRRTLHLSVTGR